ncbi:MAG: starch-binding protein [Clostridiales bacterium]|jgi:hypothetical protein|nr:starch-binding protein [Clostridiales bacterium]
MLKKSFGALIALLTLAAVSAPAAVVFAAPEDELAVAYVSVPADWETPCVWAWDDAGKGAFDAWPGGELEKDPANVGWYYIYLPVWASNIIVNANDGEVQTSGEIKSPGGDFWITVKSPEEVEITADKQTMGDAPAYVEKIAIHARVPQAWEKVNLWARLAPDGMNAFDAWPGEAMKATDGGWFTAKAPAWINSIIVNGGAESIQTADLTIEPKEVWVVVNDDLTAEVSYSNPDLNVAGITVRAKVPNDWADPCLWAWLDPDGTNAFAAWPGEPFVKDGDWYTLQAPGWINSIIVNANDGAVQTVDSKGLEVGKDLWIVVTDAENYVVDYKEIDASAVASVPVSTETPKQEEPMADAPSPTVDTTVSGVSSVVWVIVGIAAAVVGAAVAVVVVRKSKKK